MMTMPQPYRDGDAAQDCPICHCLLEDARSGTCANCGVWWARAGQDSVAPRGPLSDASEPPLPLRVTLRQSIGWGSGIVFLYLTVFGYGASWFIFDASWSGLTWAAVLVSLPLGLLVGTYCGVVVVRLLLHQLVPSRLDGEESALRVRVWNT